MSPGHERDRFDDMIVEIDTRLFEIQIMLSHFAMELLEESPDCTIEGDFSLPLQGDSGIDVFRVVKVAIEKNEDAALIISGGSGEKMTWNDLDVAAQYLLANSLHRIYVSRRFLGGDTSLQ